MKRRINEARTTIRQLVTPTSQRVNITQVQVIEWWELFNTAIFNDELKTPYEILILEDMKDDYGWCEGYRDRYQVRFTFLTSYSSMRIFFEVLAHEMVHQWQWYTIKRFSHGPKHFMSWREPIAKATGVKINKNITDWTLPQ